MRRVPNAALLLAAVTFWPTRPAASQAVRFRVEGVGLTYQEVDSGRDAIGAGGGGGFELRIKRFRLDARAFAATINPDSAAFENYEFAQVDVRGGYVLTPYLALEVGGGRRFVKPTFAAQEVGYVRVGVLSENVLNRLSVVWVRGAFLPSPRFSGGGTAELAFEFSLGVGIGTANGRFRFQAEYEFQRIDREVEAVSVPIQISVARTGFAFGF